MRIIQPEAHILPVTGSILQHVERCGRIAYKSENAITEYSHVNFIKRIIESGHESVLEHGNYVFELADDDYEVTIEIYNALIFESLNEKGYGKRLRFTNSSEKNIVSGNIRAFRDFIRLVRAAENEKAGILFTFHIPSWIEAAFYDNVAFCDLGLESKNTWFRQLQREDLTPFEQKVHWAETVHFICSRAISHEFVRHRALSPTQESQRYCAYNKGKFGGEITYIEPEYFADRKTFAYSEWANAMYYAECTYMRLLEMGKQPQQAREVLPNSTKTELVMTGTIGEWMHFFSLRCADDAHPEARRLAKPLRKEFSENYDI